MKTPLDEEFLLGCLEELAGRIGLPIRCEPIPEEEIPVAGGMCRIRGTPVVLINRRATRKEKIQVYIQAIRRYDLSGVYILPAVRRLLESPAPPRHE